MYFRVILAPFLTSKWEIGSLVTKLVIASAPLKHVDQGMANCSAELSFSPLIKISLDDKWRRRSLHSKYVHLFRWISFSLTMKFVYYIYVCIAPVYKKRVNGSSDPSAQLLKAVYWNTEILLENWTPWELGQRSDFSSSQLQVLLGNKENN